MKTMNERMNPSAWMGKTERHILESLDKNGALLFALIDPLDYQSLDHAVKTAKNADEAGADVIVVRHPESIKRVKNAIDELMEK